VLFEEALLHIDATAFEDYGSAHEAAMRTGTLFTPLARLFFEELVMVQNDLPPDELPDTKSLTSVLYSAAACLASLQPDSTTDRTLAQNFTDSLESFKRRQKQPSREGLRGRESFATAFELAFSMFHNLIVNHCPLTDKQNAKLSSDLRLAIISMSNDPIWAKLAFLRTWM
jgi:hypothetical protein